MHNAAGVCNSAYYLQCFLSLLFIAGGPAKYRQAHLSSAVYQTASFLHLHDLMYDPTMLPIAPCTTPPPAPPPGNSIQKNYSPRHSLIRILALCRPLLHALIHPGVASGYGIEIDQIKCSKAHAFLRQSAAALLHRGLTSKALAVPVVKCSAIEKVTSRSRGTLVQ